MAFNIGTSLGLVTPTPAGASTGGIPAIAPSPVWDNITPDDMSYTNDWTKTVDRAEVATKNGNFSFRQGVQFNYRQVGMFNNGTLVSQYQCQQHALPDYIGFIARYTDETQTEATLYFAWVIASNETEAVERIQGYTGGTGAVGEPTWGFTVGTFGASDFPKEWDETPSEDENNPFNENAIGGEFADRGAFDANDLMLLEDMPDPEADEMGFGGLIMCYALHEVELRKIAQALFLPNFWTSLKNKFEGLSDPMSFILDAVELPLPITDYGIGPFQLGGITVQDSGGNNIGCATYPYRFKKYDMGAIALKEVWGSEKDYSCTTISIFLPYVGVKELDPDIVLNSRLTLVLYVDRWNGDILYLLHASNNLAQQKYYRQENVVYRFAGNCGRKVPLGRVDNSNQIIQAVSGLAGIAAGYAMGGVVGAIGGAVPTIQNIAAGNFKPTVQTSGGVSGNTGRMDYQQAYLIIKRGVPEYPNNWRSEIGAPRGQELPISSLSGYTLFSTVYLENIECMAEEKAELERLLTTEGVIL